MAMLSSAFFSFHSSLALIGVLSWLLTTPHLDSVRVLSYRWRVMLVRLLIILAISYLCVCLLAYCAGLDVGVSQKIALMAGDIWAPASKIQSFEIALSPKTVSDSMPQMHLITAILKDTTTPWMIVASIIAALWQGVVRYKRLMRFRQWLKLIPTYRKIYGIEIKVFDDAIHGAVIPFVTLINGSPVVVLPQSLVMTPLRLQTALKHEFQHIKHKDLAWGYVYEGLSILCFLNPFVHLFVMAVNQLEEFRCDESLAGQRVSLSRYSDCLWWAAQQMSGGPLDQSVVRQLFGIGSRQENILTRRFQMLERIANKGQMSRFKSWSGGCVRAGILVVSCISVLATAGVDRDERFNLSKFEQAVAETSKSQIPLQLNPRIMEQLHRYVDSDAGRQFIDNCIHRLSPMKEQLIEQLTRQRAPIQLLAIPCVESGMVNLEDDGVKAHGAGLWMIVRSTARHLGLTIDETQDQRLDYIKATEAAAKLLTSDYNSFLDWSLAILSYNVGSRGVTKAIEANGSRDPWKLIENHVENDKNYLAKVYAVMLLYHLKGVN